MIASVNHRNVCAVLLLVAFSMTGYRGITGQQEVPGVVVNHSHPDTKTYLGSPSIAILKDDGTYVASHDYFGPGSI